MRVIINNESHLCIQDALRAVQRVIRNGRISDNGKCYCYVTVFPELQVAVMAKLLKVGDSFKVVDSKNHVA